MDNNEELQMIMARHKKRMNGTYEVVKPNKVGNAFSKILLSIIFILISCIYIHLNQENHDLYKKTIFADNLTFAKINNWYHKTFGSFLPTMTTLEDQTVMKTSPLLSKEPYLDGYKIYTSKGSPIEAVQSGILVFLENKDGYGKTAIVQGIDGVDIWYGNLTDVNVKLYEYIEKGTILGNSEADYFYQVFYKEGQKMDYEQYFNQVES